MVASPRQRLILPLAPTGAGVAGVLTALAFAVMPSGALEALVVDSGVASLINAAQPPLGLTARAVLALVGGGAVTGLAWVALFVAVGTRAVILNLRAGGESGPALRRADVHPDAPPRQPVFANRDLGTPFLEVRAEAAPPVIVEAVPDERALPADLDMPLAAFDPQSFAAPLAAQAAALDMPSETPLPIRLHTGSTPDGVAASLPNDTNPAEAPTRERAVAAPLERTMTLIATSMRDEAPAEILREARAEQPAEAAMPIRLDTGRAIDFIAASMQQPPARPAEADSPASIRALLDRLERSVAQREAAPPPSAPSRQERQDSIRDTLETLRGLATRAG